MAKNTMIKKRKKKDERNVIKLVRKSNNLVEARYKFDIWETRIFTKMLTMVKMNDDDFCSYRIYLSDLVRDFGLESNKDAYDRLRAGGFKLMRKIIKIIKNTEEGMMELSTPIIIGLENPLNTEPDDAKFINVSFHPDMKPYLISLKSQFTTYDVRNILKLPSSYSIRIYELLKQYQRIGRRKFELRELKEIIGVVEEIDLNGKKSIKDNYPLYGNFRQRVLLKAQRDLLKNTDIKFDFDPIKKGRRVHEILFYIQANNPSNQQEPIDIQELPFPKKESGSNEELVAELHLMIEEWVGKGLVRKWVALYTEQQIRKGIRYTLNKLKSGKTIDNVVGYLQTMIKQENLIDPIELKRKKAVKKANTKQEQAVKKQELKTTLKMLYIELTQVEGSIIEKIYENGLVEKKEMVARAKLSRFSQYNEDLSIEDNLKNPIFAASYHNAIKKRFPKKFEQISSQYNLRIEQLKTAISKL
jgi:plasmid replication initiation protein